MITNKLLGYTSGLLLGFAVTLAILIPSCATKPQPQPVSSLPLIADLKQANVNVHDGLKQTTADIKQQATAGQKATPPAVLPALNPFWLGIYADASKQDTYVTQLANQNAQIDTLKSQNTTMEQWGVSQQTRATKAEESTSKELKHQYIVYSGWLFFLALIAGGIAVAGKGPLASIGGAVAALAAIGSAVCIFVVQSVSLIPWIIGGLCVLITAYVIYRIVKGDNLQTATTDLVKSTELIKQSLPGDARRKLFGNGAILDLLQNNETKAVVAQTRAEIPEINQGLDLNGDGVVDANDLPFARTAEQIAAIQRILT